MRLGRVGVALGIAGLGVTWGVHGARSGDAESTLRASDLRRHVQYLAADGMRGRDTGEPEIAVAEEYVAGEFRKYGLEPLPGQDGFLVEFALFRSSFDVERTRLRLDLGDRTLTAEAGVDFRPFPFSDSGELEAGIVFAGYGISAPEFDHDDYEGLDVSGKLVLLLRHEPREEDPASRFDGLRSTDHALFSTKAQTAQDHGAVGMLLVTDPLHHARSDDFRLTGRLRLDRSDVDDGGATADGEVDEQSFLALHIGRELAEAIVARDGKSLEALQIALDGGERPATLPSIEEIRVRVSVERAAEVERVSARNVVGFLPGSDPERRDEWIVVGGHHDHIGGYGGSGDTIYNGADDNASGTSGVLELAQAFAGAATRPRRSLVFATFSAEERGLLGSRAFVEQGAIPVDQVVFMLNLDMIGRNPRRAVDAVGDGYVRGLREIVEASNRKVELDLEFGGTSYTGNSDHDSFYERDVPFLFFFTGTHDDYHQLGDHADKLDYRRMQSIVRVAYGVVDRLGRADGRPRFVHNIGWLGARVDVDDATPGAAVARVTGVETESRAAAAGLRKGDVLYAFDGVALDVVESVGARFREIEPGSHATLGIRRGGSELAIVVERAKSGYLGVYPGPIDDEVRRSVGLPAGQGIAIREVTSDGPAARAGLLTGDILVRLAGRPIGLGDLATRLAQIGAGEVVTIQVVREGERLDLELILGQRPERP